MPPSFRRIIEAAYTEILERGSDPGGLASFQAAMEGGTTEAQVREAMIRSAEYEQKNPGHVTPPPDTGGQLVPLKVQGNKFVRSDNGAVVKLLGMVVAGDDPGTQGTDEGLALGWPLLTHEAIDLMAAHKLNYSVFRLGPNIDRNVFGDGEAPEFCGYKLVDGKYDLTQWHEPFWAMLAERLDYSRARGIYVCCSGGDSWNLHHEVTPMSAARNIQGYEGGSLEIVKRAPDEVWARWFTKVARTLAPFRNALVIDGNESFKGHPSEAWVMGIKQIMEAEWERLAVPPRLYGTNSGLDVPVDFVVLHDQNIPEPGPKPIIVDEYPTKPVAAVLRMAKQGWDDGGVAYIYWKGEHTTAERDTCLAGLKVIAEGGDAAPMPEACPRLVRWQPRVHIVMDSHRRLIDSGIPEEGGFVFFDSTPRYGSGGGHPCNDEHPNDCLGCEDPRGGIWSQTAGPAVQVRVENPGTNGHGYQCLVGPLGPAGTRYAMRIEALPDAQDAYGRPLDVAPNHAREESFTVGQPTRAALAVAGSLAAVDEPLLYRRIPYGILAAEEYARYCADLRAARLEP